MTAARISVHGFSLMELLVILSLIAVLSFLAIQGISSATQASSIATAAEMITDVFADGRSAAVAQNTTVEVRLYYVPSHNGTAAAYSAIQLHWLKADGTTPPVSHVSLLPSNVVIDASPDHSPMIAANNQAATPDSSDSRLNNQTHVFHFLPDGSTDLSPATNWFLSVRAATASDPAHFPSNWASVGINATTGRAQIYCP